MAYGYNNRDFKDYPIAFIILNFIVLAICFGGIITIPLSLVWLFVLAPKVLEWMKK